MKFSPLRSIWLSFCLLILILPASVSAEPAAAGLNRFLKAYTTPVFDILTHIHGHEMTKYGRFLILSSKIHPDYYVQCLFFDKDSNIYCEAASGYYSNPQYHISAKGRNAIKNMGFRMFDGKGNLLRTRFNFQRNDIAVTGPEALWEVSGVMLETLYRGYGVPIGDVKLCAPFALETEECDSGGMWHFPWPHIARGVEEKIDKDEGFTLIKLAKGANHGALDGGLLDDISPFLIYQELGKYEGTADWLAVNPWTGDVWSLDEGPPCKHFHNRALKQEQERIKKQFSKDELKEYKRLSELTPRRMYDLEPCGSPEEK